MRWTNEGCEARQGAIRGQSPLPGKKKVWPWSATVGKRAGGKPGSGQGGEPFINEKKRGATKSVDPRGTLRMPMIAGDTRARDKQERGGSQIKPRSQEKKSRPKLSRKFGATVYQYKRETQGAKKQKREIPAELVGATPDRRVGSNKGKKTGKWG